MAWCLNSLKMQVINIVYTAQRRTNQRWRRKFRVTQHSHGDVQSLTDMKNDSGWAEPHINIQWQFKSMHSGKTRGGKHSHWQVKHLRAKLMIIYSTAAVVMRLDKHPGLYNNLLMWGRCSGGVTAAGDTQTGSSPHAPPLLTAWCRGTVDTCLCLEGTFYRSSPCLSSVCDQLLLAFRKCWS